MGSLLKVLGFSLSLILVFTLVANLLPQLGEAPVEEEINLGELTMGSFVALGEQIFSGKGTCTLCHNNMGRAPDLRVDNVVENAQKRMSDERYQGKAIDVEGYLRESMVEPGAYVVAGFGKKGSNDSESPMPKVLNPPIQLTEVEIDAIIAFLQAKDGNEVTVELPTDTPVMADKTGVEAPQVAQSAEEVLAKYSCTACHAVMESGATVGPGLKNVGNRLSANEIRQSVVDPAAVIAEGFPPIMPPTIAENMTVKELEMLVRYLTQQKSE